MLANYLTPVIGLVASVVAARYVAPKEMGSIQAAMLFMPYLAMLHLGAFTGLNRNLAYYLGKGDREKAMRMVGASAFVAKLNAWLGLTFGIGFIIFQLSAENPDLIMLGTSVALTIALVFTPFITHISTTNRSGQHFKEFGKVVLVANALRTGYLFLPALLGWIGHIVSLSIQPLIRLFLLKRKEPYPGKKEFGRTDLYELIKVGFPIMVNGYIAGLLLIADQTLVALFMSKEDLGYYSLARLTMTALMIIPATLSILLSPKVAACYGRTHDSSALRGYVWKLLLVHVAFILPVCGIAYLLVEPVVQWALPKYVPGIAVAKITILSCIGFIFSGLLIITSTLRKNLVPIICYAIALGAMWIAGYAMTQQSELTIEQIAWLRFNVTMILSIFILSYVFISTRKKQEDRR